MDRLYCTIAELVADLAQTSGCDETAWLRHIRTASQFIDDRMGMFIPLTEAKRFDGNGKDLLFVPPLLAVTSIVDDDNTLAASDYLLYPRDRYWSDGPYTRIAHDPDGTYGVWTQEKDAIVITGRWGKYEKSLATGATVQNNPLAIADTGLVVADGSKLSPGMVLLIESEQALITATGSPTAGVTTITEPATASDDELTLANATLVNVGEVIRIDLEKMLVLDKNTTTQKVSVYRGYNGTKKAAHADNASVDAYRTFTISRAVNGTTAAAHVQTTAINRYIPPEPINFLCREIASLIKNLAGSGYAGKTGNAELGQVFYNEAFPRWDLERIELLYKV